MSGIASWQAEIKLDIEQLKSRLSEAEKELGNVTEKEHKVKLDIDTKTLDSAIKKLDKMLDSLGKGTGDFKQFENLGTQLESITSDVKSLSNAFSKIDDSKLQGFFSSIQNIDNTLDRLSNHILTVGQSMNKIGSDNGIKDAVKNTQSLTKANEEAAKSAEKLANAQKNISGGSSNNFVKNILPNEKDFNKVLSKLDLTKSKLGEIAKITEKSHADKDGKFSTSYILQDKNGSTETYGEKSKTDRGQLLSSNYVKYNAKANEKVRKEQEEKNKARQDSVNKALKDQESAWKNIQSIREKISKTSDSAEIQNLQQIKNGYREQYIEANKVLKANSDLYDKELQRSKLQQIKTDTDKKIAEPQEKEDKQARSKAKSYVESAQKKLKDAISKYSYGDTSEASIELQKLSKAWSNFATKDNPNPTLEQVEARMKEIDKTVASIISKLKTDHTSKLNKLNDEIKDEDKKDRKDKADKKKKTSDENASKWSKFNNELNKTKKSEERRLQGKSFDDQVKSFEQLEQELTDFHTQGIISEKQFTDAKNKIDGIKQHLEEMKDDINKNFTDNLDKSVEKYQKVLEERQNKPTNQNQGKPYKDALKEYSSKLAELEAIQTKIRNNDGLATEDDKTRVKELTKEIEKYSDALKNMSAANKGSTEISRQKELQKIGDYLQRNTKISEEAKAKLKEYMAQLKSGSASTNIEHIHTEFLKIAQAEREAGREGKSFFSVIKEKVFYGAAGSIASYFGINDLIQYGRQAAEVVTNLNSQIVDLAKVSEDSISQIYDDFDSYADIAKDIGGTISDTIEATAAWAKNGYNIPDSKELARVSQLYQNVGDNIDIQSANESLISTLKGFRLEADQAEHIVDVFNEVSNNEAISSSGIGAALQRSAASFNAANTTLEQSTALVTATNTVLQDEEKTGNMWKTVSARLRGADAELKEMGEDTDGMVTSTSKLRDLIKGMTGFDIMKDENTFKSIYDIIIGIGEQWNNLSDVNRASLLEKLAGKQQSNALAAALSNIDVLKKSYNEAMNADGSAMQEQQKYQKSIQYSIDQTKAKLEELSNDVLSSDFLKGAIDSAGKFVDILDKIANHINLIQAAAIGASAFLSANNIGKRMQAYTLQNFVYCFEYALLSQDKSRDGML